MGKSVCLDCSGSVIHFARCRRRDSAKPDPDKRRTSRKARPIANEQVFKGFGCTGGNISPALSWSGAPAATKSFAVSIYDPDAPTGSGWWHWVVFNIPAERHVAAEGRGRREEEADAEGRDPEPDRFRRRRLWRSVSADRRQAASLPDHGVRGRRRQAAGRQGRYRPRPRWSASTCTSTRLRRRH